MTGRTSLDRCDVALTPGIPVSVSVALPLHSVARVSRRKGDRVATHMTFVM
jgi:hypothetical protein